MCTSTLYINKQVTQKKHAGVPGNPWVGDATMWYALLLGWNALLPRR